LHFAGQLGGDGAELAVGRGLGRVEKFGDQPGVSLGKGGLIQAAEKGDDGENGKIFRKMMFHDADMIVLRKKLASA